MCLLVLLASTAGAAVTTPGPVYEPPLANGSSIAAAHAGALDAAGGFTYADRTTIAVNGTVRTNLRTTARFDATSSARLVERRSLGAADQTIYADGEGSAYERITSPEGAVSYGQPLGMASQESRYRRPGIDSLLGDVDYTYVGTATVDGVTVAEYAATDATQLVDLIGPAAAAPDVETTVDVRVYISPDGVVRLLTIHLFQRDGGRTRSLNSSLSYGAVGSTTVDPPAWIETARARTGPPR